MFISNWRTYSSIIKDVHKVSKIGGALTQEPLLFHKSGIDPLVSLSFSSYPCLVWGYK